MVAWADNYWGKDNPGYGVVCANAKKGWKAHTELGEFLRERIGIEEHVVKETAKYLKHALPQDVGIHGPTFGSIRLAAAEIHDAHSVCFERLKKVKDEAKSLDERMKKEAQAIKDSSVPKLLEAANQSQAAATKQMRKTTKSQKRTSGATTVDDLLQKHNKDVENFETAMVDFCNTMENLGREDVDRLHAVVINFVEAERDKYTKCLEALSQLEQRLNEQNAVYCADHLCSATSTGTERPSASPLGGGPAASDASTVKIETPQVQNPPDGPPSEVVAQLAKEASKEDVSTTTITRQKSNSFSSRIMRSLSKKGASGSNQSVNQPVPGPNPSTVPEGSQDSFASNTQIQTADTAPATTVPAVPTPTPQPPTNEGEGFEVDEAGYRIRKEETVPQEVKEVGVDHTSESEGEEEEVKPKLVVKIRPDIAENAQVPVDPELYRLQMAPIRVGTLERRMKKQDSIGSLQAQTPTTLQRDGSFFGLPPPTIHTAPIPSPSIVTPTHRLSGFDFPTSSRPLSLVGVDAKLALTETVNAYFKGPTLGKAVVTGQLLCSFPPTILHTLTPDSAPVMFTLEGHQKLSNIVLHDQLKASVDSETGKITVEPGSLLEFLKAQHTSEGGSQADLRVSLLTYSVTKGDLSVVPLRLCAIWKCEETTTTLTLHYMHNKEAVDMPLSNVSVLVQLAGGKATDCTARPDGNWSADQQRLLWNIPTINPNDASGKGMLQATFSVDAPSIPTKVMIKLTGIGCTLSQTNVVDDPSSGVAFSHIIRRFTSGKYIAESN